MTAIWLCGRQNPALGREISRVLSACGGVCRCTDKEIALDPACRFLLVQKEKAARWKTDGGVCILPPAAPLFSNWQVPPGFVAVTSSEAPAVLRMLERQGGPAVTCGMSASDTVTLSSIHENRAVVTLQRTLTTLAGRPVEPGDFPVRLASPISPYGLMAGLAALLLSDADPAAGLMGGAI